MSITGSNKPKLSGAEDFTLSIMITGYRIPSNGVYNENTTDHLVVVSNSLVTDYDLADESSVCSTPLPPLEKLTGVEPVFGPKTIKSILKSRSTFKAEYLNKFQMFVPSDSTVPKLQTAKDLQGDALLHYDAEIEVMKSDSTFHSQMNIYKLLWMLALQPRTCGKDNSMNWVNISRAKKLEKSHDPLALVAHTGSSSRNTSSYYVTHLTSVVDYDDEYQQDVFKKPILKILLASAMLLFAPSHYQISLNPIKISSSNTRRAYVQEEVVEGSNAQNETRNVQRTLRTSSSENTSTVQCYKCSGKGHDARNCPKPRIRDSKYFMEQILSNSEIPVNVRDTEDTLDDASKSQQKMKEKMNDPIAVANKQNCWTIDYKQIKALYKHFVPQKELSAEQKYFPFSFIPSDKTPNETSSIPASMPKKLENENVSLDFKVKSLMKERDNVKIEYQKLFDSIKKTRSQSKKESDELIDHVSEKTYAYSAIRAENQNLLSTISELKTRLETVEKVSKPVTLQTSPDKQRGANSTKNVIAPGMYRVVTTQESQTNEAKTGLSSTGMNDASSVRRPMNRDSYVKNNVLANSKNSAKKVPVYVRKNKQTDNTSANVISNKENVIDVNVANDSKAKTLLCVSCIQNVLIPCHDKCLANYKLNVHSNDCRAFSTNSRIPKSLDTTYVVLKTRVFMKRVFDTNHHSAAQSTQFHKDSKSSDTTINSAAQPTHDQEDSPSTSSIIVDTHEAPHVVTTSDEQNSPIILQESDSLNHEEIESSTTNLEPSNV
ncbi:retrovirus-related pol polyprotein from transposon TNT 1-94 [Tanacetum coccineum]